MFINPYQPEREQWDAQIQENSARRAWAWGTVDTHGWGERVLEDSIMFGITYMYQPIVSYGWALVDEDQLVDGRYPRCSAGVLKWVLNANDYYVGAHILVTVATADPLLAAQSLDVATDFAVDPGYDITHSFTFNGLAIKDVAM